MTNGVIFGIFVSTELEIFFAVLFLVIKNLGLHDLVSGNSSETFLADCNGNSVDLLVVVGNCENFFRDPIGYWALRADNKYDFRQSDWFSSYFIVGRHNSRSPISP